MKAVTWQGTRSVGVTDVPDPEIREPSDAIVRVSSTAICGSDLHLYELLGPFLDRGDILGHEAMGTVVEVGRGVERLHPGDRVVIPFTISCGTCFMCRRGLMSQCETTQVREHGSGAALFGYTKLYGQIPGCQAEYVRVPLADHTSIPVENDLPDERYLFLSDVLPTAWQAVEYGIAPGTETMVVLGLGPVGQMASRIALHRGLRVIAVDPVPERRAMAQRHGVAALDADEATAQALRDWSDGRGADAVVDAVGMEAHGSPGAALAQKAVGVLPDPLAAGIMERAGVDRLAALRAGIAAVRRGGVLSIAGVYAGQADPLPMLTLFDKQITLRMGQCNVLRWTDEIIGLVRDPRDPLGVTDLATHRVGLSEAARMYDLFQKKQDGCVKVVMRPEVG